MNDSELDRLLRRARATAPPSGSKARLRSRILSVAAVGGTLGEVARASAASKGSTVALAGKSGGGLLLGVLKWVAGGSALGLALASLASAVSESARSVSVAPHMVATAPPQAMPMAPVTTLQPTRAPEAAAPPPRSAVSRARVSAEAETGLPSIERETQLLSQVQRALGRGDARAALAVLDRYAAEFPHGALAEEAGAARAVAACSLGRGEQARSALDAFRRSYPRSPLLRRVSTACSDVEGHRDFETESANPTTQPNRLPPIGGSGSQQ